MESEAGRVSVAVVHLATTEGHFFSYGMAFVEAARRLHRRVVVLVPDLAPALTEAQREDLDRHEVEVRTYPSPIPRRGRAPLSWVHLREWRAVQSACRGLGEGELHLVLPYLDTMFTGMLLQAPAGCVVQTLAVTMRGDVGQHRRPRRWGERFKQFLWWRLLRMRRPDVLVTNDPLFHARVARQSATDSLGLALRLGSRPVSGLPLAFLPDFSFCTPLARPRCDAGQALVCLAIGFLDRRKHLSLLLQAVCRFRAESGSTGNGGLRLRLVGALAADALDDAGHAAMSALQAQGAVEVHSGYQSDAAYAKALAEADMVWVFYAGHDFASGVALDVMASERTLIAQESGVIGYYATRYDRSVLIPDHAGVDDVVGALARAAAGSGVDTRVAPDKSLRPPDRATYVDAITQLLALRRPADTR